MKCIKKRAILLIAVLLFALPAFFAACASVTLDLSGDAKTSYTWELVTVQANFVRRPHFLAVPEIDGQRLETPLIFNLDAFVLPPGEHRLKLVLGSLRELGESVSFDDLKKLLDASYDDWVAELGTITLKQPVTEKGRNYLVASYSRLYTNNTLSPLYRQRWLVSYPRKPGDIDAEQTWGIESIDPKRKTAETNPEADNAQAN